jgi:hypothetical protein
LGRKFVEAWGLPEPRLPPQCGWNARVTGRFDLVFAPVADYTHCHMIHALTRSIFFCALLAIVTLAGLMLATASAQTEPSGCGKMVMDSGGCCCHSPDGPAQANHNHPDAPHKRCGDTGSCPCTVVAAPFHVVAPVAVFSARCETSAAAVSYGFDPPYLPTELIAIFHPPRV